MSTIVSTGFKLPQAVISNGAVTGNEWLDPNNILLVDDDVAQSDPNNASSDFIMGNYNLNLPQDAVVTGIEFKVIGYRGAQTSPVITLTPYLMDDTSGTDVFYPYVTPFTGLTLSNAEYTLGGSTYLFASSFTPDQINNLKMQMVANGNIYLDCVLVNVYYYVPDPITPPVPSGNSCTDCNSTIQAQEFFLARPFKSGETKAYLKSFNYPDGTPILYTDLGSCGGYLNLVFDEGKPKTDQNDGFEENTRLAVWTILPNGLVELDFSSITNRGRQFHTPNGHDINLVSDHNANSRVIISNNSDYENRRLQRCHIGSIISAPVTVQDEGVDVVTSMDKLDFQGAGVSVVQDGSDPEKAIVTIPGVGGTTPPAPDAISSSTSGSVQVPTLTWSHVVSGVNRGLYVQVSLEGGKTVTGITYNGVAMILAGAITNGAVRSEVWYLAAPAVGTHNIVVTFSANTYCCAGAESFTGVDQAVPIGTVQTGSGTSLAPSIVVTTTYDNSIVIDGLSTASTPILYTKGAGQIENWHHTANTDTRQGGGSYELAGSAPDAVTMNWAITQSTAWALVGVEIKGLTGATPVSSPITVEDEGIVVDANVTNMDFVGPGVTVTQTSPNHVEINIPGGSSGSGEVVQKNFTKAAHGFTVGQVMKSSGVDGEFALAQGNTPANADVVGVISTVLTANSFTLTVEGFVVLSSGIPAGAVAGDDLYLDGTTPGLLTLTPPTAAGTVNQPLCRLINDSTNLVYWHNWRGIENQSVLIGGGTKIDVDPTLVSITNATETSLYSVTIPGGTLLTNNAVKVKIFVDFDAKNNASQNVTLKVKYGGATLVTAASKANQQKENGKTYIEVILAANAAVAAQIATISMACNADVADGNNVVIGNTGTGAINSAVDQTLDITWKFGTATPSPTCDKIVAVAEKITGTGTVLAAQYTVNADENISDWYTTLMSPADSTLSSGGFIFSNNPVLYANAFLADANGGIHMDNPQLLWSYKAGSTNLQFGHGYELRVKLMAQNTSPSTGTTAFGRMCFFGLVNATSTSIYSGDITNTIGGNQKRVGFAFYNGDIYAYSYDGTSATAVPVASDTGLRHLYEIVYTDASIQFYLDGVLVATILTNIPTSGSFGFGMGGINGGGGSSGFYFSPIALSQKLT